MTYTHCQRTTDRGESGGLRGPQLEPYVPVETFQAPPYEPLGPQDLVQALTVSPFRLPRAPRGLRLIPYSILDLIH